MGLKNELEKQNDLNRGENVKIYDTTLRDGCQSRDVNLSLHDKLEIIKALDDYGVDYIELGWPGTNEDDTKVFQEVKKLRLRAKTAAFGSTRKLRNRADCNLKAIVESGADVATIFGKTWLLHVAKQLGATPEQNIEAITDSVQCLKSRMEVVYDAEHFFDGYKDNAEYALETLKAAYDGGASCLVLCDTRGGTLSKDVRKILSDVKEYVAGNNMQVELGIHAHNDSGFAAANTLEAVDAGFTHLQVTVNGFGERCGNADLCAVVPALVLKYKKGLRMKLENTKKLSDLVYVLSTARPSTCQPYVGRNAFAHKGGTHLNGIERIGTEAYEHVEPRKIGNQRFVEWSNQSGRSNISLFAKETGREFDRADPKAQAMLKEVEDMFSKGYDLSLRAERELLYEKYFGKNRSFFDVRNWEVMSGMESKREYSKCEITGIVNGNERDAVIKVDGGPVDAMFKGLVKLLSPSFPSVKDIRLVNYKVRIAKDKGVESAVNVYIEYENGARWATEGISTNILEASFESFVKGFRYHLIKKRAD
jgi:2-isopropylmalate synthase